MLPEALGATVTKKIKCLRVHKLFIEGRHRKKRTSEKVRRRQRFWNFFHSPLCLYRGRNIRAMTRKFDEEITEQILRYEVWLEITLRAFNGPESKLQIIQWETPAAQRLKKCTTELRMKSIHVTIFDMMGTAHSEFTSQGQPTNYTYYVEIQTRLELCTRRRLKVWPSWSRTFEQIVANWSTVGLEHPTHSPNFPANDLYSFQTITVHLEGTKISHRKHSVKSDGSAGGNSAKGLT
jgi:hypothetical protein